MFDHSIKVPRLYKTASKIAREVSEGKGSIKQLVYECKHPNIKALYALVVHTFQKTDDIDKLLKKSKLLVKEPRFDPWLAKVLITELLWGKKHLASQSKPVKTILAYEQIFKAHLSDVDSNDLKDLEQVDKPRYVRINTLKITINEAIEGFREEGWFLKRYTDSDNYLGFLQAVANLGPEEFMVDLHIPYLLIFPPKTQFYQHRSYKNGSIILQDKASCLPAHILNPEPGSTILDMCAAPGMKTTQCAALIEDNGNIYAVEIGNKRYQTLNKIIESSGATCINTMNADVLTLTAEQCPRVEYILVDPSCSGSGITGRIDIGQQETENPQARLEKLAGFQIKILRHALTRFPNAKRVVYSTCSVYPEENEDVVRQVLETCTGFKLVPAAQFVEMRWHSFGSSDFGDIGNYCLYAKPDVDLTSGFFVAVFEKLEEGESNVFLNRKIFSSRLQRSRNENFREYGDQQESREETDIPKDKKKRKKAEADDVVIESTVAKVEECSSEMNDVNANNIDEDVQNNAMSDVLDGTNCKSKKKKKKKHKHTHESQEVQNENPEIKKEDVVLDEPTKKTKKKKKDKYTNIHELETGAEIDNVSTTKHKRRKRDLEEESTVVTDPLEENLHQEKKSKKKKRKQT